MREREDKHRPWIFFLIFSCSFNMLVWWFCLHRSRSNVKPLFRAHPKMGAATLSSLLTHFQKGVVPYFCLMAPWWGREKHIPFQLFLTCIKAFGPLILFLVLFNYCGHSTMTGWPTTNVLAWVTQRSAGHRLCVCLFFFLFFIFFLLLQKLASHSLYNLSQPYQVIARSRIFISITMKYYEIFLKLLKFFIIWQILYISLVK